MDEQDLVYVDIDVLYPSGATDTFTLREDRDSMKMDMEHGMLLLIFRNDERQVIERSAIIIGNAARITDRKRIVKPKPASPLSLVKDGPTIQ